MTPPERCHHCRGLTNPPEPDPDQPAWDGLCFICRTFPPRTRPVLVGARYDRTTKRLVDDPGAGASELIGFDVARGHGDV